jgi:lipopolysaccharide transport system ATP-binding protein
MSDVAIRVEALGKQYWLNGRAPYETLRERINSLCAAPFSLFRKRRGEAERTSAPFWALKDVSFEVKQGEVLGIIGRNGAGKSTLLKILSRITEPTEGEADLHGRVGSLLEVGTGFNPELSGRENLFLNGAILGMRRAEIARKFDEIVAFAEVEQFIDTPVKRYSSGMYTRLAFAVAAHLEPEILIVDEVLAVGDAQFQKKCLGKMSEVARSGRTVLFVSHNMGAINTLTDRCLLLHKGRLALDGSPEVVIAAYLGAGPGRGGQVLDLSGYRRSANGADAEVTLREAWASVEGAPPEAGIRSGQAITISLVVEARRAVTGACVSIALFNARQERVVQLLSYDQGMRVDLARGVQTVRCTLPGLPLSPGGYYMDAGVARASDVLSWDVVLQVPLFSVIDELGGLEWHDRPWGCLHLADVKWEVSATPSLPPQSRCQGPFAVAAES